MKRNIILTTDGSHSIAIPEMGVTYHSSHGAIQESEHVFIKTGLHYLQATFPSLSEIRVFEMGFGTGLNALLTLIEAEKKQQQIFYHSIERFPLQQDLYQSLNYCTALQRADLQAQFDLLHDSPWNIKTDINPNFSLLKTQENLASFTSSEKFHLVYFDAFAPENQPELWTQEVFEKLFYMMEPGGVLTTYCSKSIVRKAMKAAGFTVEKIPGPPHKREIVRAAKRS
ncbi:MAG: tRNA (5-methylaminomethyl-2-thiouridine)(34)-methyltransferase MnmD [Chitinophagaceae bacterium]